MHPLDGPLDQLLVPKEGDMANKKTDQKRNRRRWRYSKSVSKFVFDIFVYVSKFEASKNLMFYQNICVTINPFLQGRKIMHIYFHHELTFWSFFPFTFWPQGFCDSTNQTLPARSCKVALMLHQDIRMRLWWQLRPNPLFLGLLWLGTWVYPSTQ